MIVISRGWDGVISPRVSQERPWKLEVSNPGGLKSIPSFSQKSSEQPEACDLASDRPCLCTTWNGFCSGKSNSVIIRSENRCRAGKEQVLSSVGWVFNFLNLKLQEVFCLTYIMLWKKIRVSTFRWYHLKISISWLLLKKSNDVETLGQIPT